MIWSILNNWILFLIILVISLLFSFYSFLSFLINLYINNILDRMVLIESNHCNHELIWKWWMCMIWYDELKLIEMDNAIDWYNRIIELMNIPYYVLFAWLIMDLINDSIWYLIIWIWINLLVLSSIICYEINSICYSLKWMMMIRYFLLNPIDLSNTFNSINMNMIDDDDKSIVLFSIHLNDLNFLNLFHLF